MDNRIVELSSMLEERAKVEAECFPVDRHFLQKHINEIFSLDQKEFIFFNLERGSNTYTVQLLLCLPELWEFISADELLEMPKRFTNIFSFYTLIEFTHKFIEINIIEAILRIPEISGDIKKNITDYLIGGWFFNLVKTDGDLLFFEEGLYGVSEDVWWPFKEKFLADNRILPAAISIDEMAFYVKKLT